MSDSIDRQAAIDAIKKSRFLVDAMEKVIKLPSAQLEIIHCEDCIYYDPPHVENNGMRLEYADLPKEALIAGLATCEYGINIGGRCTRDYNAGYVDDKRVYVPRDNFCGRAIKNEGE